MLPCKYSPLIKKHVNEYKFVHLIALVKISWDCQIWFLGSEKGSELFRQQEKHILTEIPLRYSKSYSYFSLVVEIWPTVVLCFPNQ